MNLFGDRTLLQMSYDRISSLVAPERVLVVTNAAYASAIREQLLEIPPENIIGEPMRRDTAAAVALAALLIEKRFGNPVIVTLTADHLIEPVAVFQKILLSAVNRAALDNNVLYTFGIEPTYPATAYGYLERGRKICSDDDIEHFELLRFKEKPGFETARNYVASGRFYWNSGMFVWSTGAILSALKRHLPEHLKAVVPIMRFDQTGQWEEALEGAFLEMPRVSIDFGLMEKAEKVCCVVADFSWSDVGGWVSLGNCLPDDAHGNACRATVRAMNATDNVVYCEDPEETVMLVGVKDLVIVRARAGILVAQKDSAEDVKKLVEKMMKGNAQLS